MGAFGRTAACGMLAAAPPAAAAEGRESCGAAPPSSDAAPTLNPAAAEWRPAPPPAEAVPPPARDTVRRTARAVLRCAPYTHLLAWPAPLQHRTPLCRALSRATGPQTGRGRGRGGGRDAAGGRCVVVSCMRFMRAVRAPERPLGAMTRGSSGRSRGGERSSAPPPPRRAPPAPEAAPPPPPEPEADAATSGAAGRRRAAAANHLLNFSYAAPPRAAPPASVRQRGTLSSSASHGAAPTSVARMRVDRQRKDLFLQARTPCATLAAALQSSTSFFCFAPYSFAPFSFFLSAGAFSLCAAGRRCSAAARRRRGRLRRHHGLLG